MNEQQMENWVLKNCRLAQSVSPLITKSPTTDYWTMQLKALGILDKSNIRQVMEDAKKTLDNIDYARLAQVLIKVYSEPQDEPLKRSTPPEFHPNFPSSKPWDKPRSGPANLPRGIDNDDNPKYQPL
jgi:hypothetical protein